MEHVTDIDKQKHIERCKKVVNKVMSEHEIELLDHDLTLLTEQIMDTSLMMGGDYCDEHIASVAKQYIDNDFLKRFKRTIGE